MLAGMKSYPYTVPYPYTVLDGGSKTGQILDLSPGIREWTVGGQTFRDVGELHDHAQHVLVRWFRLLSRTPGEQGVSHE